MAKTKVCSHPGALAELLKSKNMTQIDAAKHSGIDRKTLAKIDRGEEVKQETLQKLANKLRVPISHFDPPADISVDQGDSQRDDPWLDLMPRKVDADALMDLMFDLGDEDQTDRFEWRLNVHTVDDEAVPLLEQLEEAVKDFNQHLSEFGLQNLGPRFVLRRSRTLVDPNDDAELNDHTGRFAHASLREQLDGLKKIKHVANLLEELAKHGLAVLGGEYLYWKTDKVTDPITQCSSIDYVSRSTILLSIERHPAHERRQKVWLGHLPPKFAPDSTLIYVDGVKLETSSSVASSEDSNAQ